MNGSVPFEPVARSAARARELLSQVLELLQRPGVRFEALEHAIENTAEASSALYELQNTSSTQAGSQARLRYAVERLSRALGGLQEQSAASAEIGDAVSALAHALAVLYPVASTALRQRRGVMLPGAEGLPSSAAAPSTLSPSVAQVIPPVPTVRPRRDSPRFDGANRRSNEADRVVVEADIGLFSSSHFYTGLTLDLSRGGLFVATYQPQPAGTEVTLCFVLPDGVSIEARGVVRWTREASADTPPGMGVAFNQLSPEQRAAIERYCSLRAPLYHESGDSEPAKAP